MPVEGVSQLGEIEPVFEAELSRDTCHPLVFFGDLRRPQSPRLGVVVVEEIRLGALVGRQLEAAPGDID